MKRLVLIDGHAILHRAYHALPPLTNRSGELVNAVYGFCSILLKVIDDLNPQYLVVTFDTPKPTFRKQEFVGYQAKRPKMDAELAGQIEKVQRVLKAFKIPIYEVPGFEADDVIGTLARQATKVKSHIPKGFPNGNKSKVKSDMEVIIVTGDKDLFQLVNKKVKLYMPIHGLSAMQIFGEREVAEKMGVGPDKIVDYKGLVGDPSDNYPGVPGIGPKGAIDLIKKFGSVEKVYQSLEKIESQTLLDKLKAGKESSFLSKKLATVVTNVSVKLDLEKSRLHDFANEEVIRVLADFGFKSLISRITGGKTEEGRQKAEDRERKMEDRKQKTDGVEQKTLF